MDTKKVNRTECTLCCFITNFPILLLSFVLLCLQLLCPRTSEAQISPDRSPCYLFGSPRPEAGCARRLLGNVVRPADGPGPAKWLGLLGHQKQGVGARDWSVWKPRGVEAHLPTITAGPGPRRLRNRGAQPVSVVTGWPQRTVGSVTGQDPPVLEIRGVAVIPPATRGRTILRRPGVVVLPSIWPLITQAGGRPPPGNKLAEICVDSHSGS